MQPIDAIGYQHHPDFLPVAWRRKERGRDKQEEGPHHFTVDRGRPHSSLTDGTRAINANGTRTFGDDSSDSDEDGDQEKALIVVCRHMALLYCLMAQNNPDHVPKADDIHNLRRKEFKEFAPWADRMAKGSVALHLICSRDFGLFLRVTFAEMQQAAQTTTTNNNNIVASRVYFVGTDLHALALRLVYRLVPSGTGEQFEVSVYDPNYSNHHVQCWVNNLYEFTEGASAHDFLAYILPQGLIEQEKKSTTWGYFDKGLNPSLQMILHELAPKLECATPATLHTDWAASPIVTRYQGYQARSRSLYAKGLKDVLAQAMDWEVPGNLFKASDFEPTSLFLLMYYPDTEFQLRSKWRQVWEQLETDSKTYLLSANDEHGLALEFIGRRRSEGGLAWWLEMLKTLPAQQIQAVLSQTNEDGLPALASAINDPEILKAINPLMEAMDSPARKAILCARDKKGRTALGRVSIDGSHEGLAIWLRWLTQSVPAQDLPAMLKAPNGQGTPFLARAIAVREPAWIDTWVEALKAVPPAEVASLVNGDSAGELPAALRVADRGHEATLKAWLKGWRLVPANKAFEVLEGSFGHNALPPKTPPLVVSALRSTSESHRDCRAVWLAVLHSLPAEERLQLLRACNDDGQPILTQLIYERDADAVRTWGDWTKQLLDKAERRDLLLGKDREGNALLSQTWSVPPSNVVEREEYIPSTNCNGDIRALQAWMDLCLELGTETLMDLLAGHNLKGEPAWVGLCRQHQNAELVGLAELMQKCVPPECRPDMVQRMDFTNEAARDAFLHQASEDPIIGQRLNEAVLFLQQWIAPDLLAKIRALNLG